MLKIWSRTQDSGRSLLENDKCQETDRAKPPLKSLRKGAALPYGRLALTALTLWRAEACPGCILEAPALIQTLCIYCGSCGVFWWRSNFFRRWKVGRRPWWAD